MTWSGPSPPGKAAGASLPDASTVAGESQLEGNFLPVFSSLMLGFSTRASLLFAGTHLREPIIEKPPSPTPAAEAAEVREDVATSIAPLGAFTAEGDTSHVSQGFEVTLAVRDLLISVAPAVTAVRQLHSGGTASPSISMPPADSSVVSTVAAGLTSASPPSPSPEVGSILDALVTQLTNQFMSTMSTCANLIMSGERSFDFVKNLLGNQIDQIELIGGLERGQICRTKLEKLRDWSAALYSHTHADVIELSRLAYEKKLADKNSALEDLKRKVEEETQRLQEMQVSDANAQKDMEMSRYQVETLNTGIATAKASLAKIQAYIKASEVRLVKENHTLSVLGTKREQLQQELTVRASHLEDLRLQLATTLSLPDESLRRKASEEVEMVRREGIAQLMRQIRMLTEQM
jgi:hypothetical protein